jgi:hypothetical protein
MTYFLIIWFLVVIINAVIRATLYPLYFDLKPIDKIKNGYLTSSESFSYLTKKWLITDTTKLLEREYIHYRYDIQLKGLYRALFKKLDYKTLLRNANKALSDVSQLNPDEYTKTKAKRKLFY